MNPMSVKVENLLNIPKQNITVYFKACLLDIKNMNN